MAEAFTLSQEQACVLEEVMKEIVKNDGKSYSSEDLGIIKHIISPEDFEILRRNFSVRRKISTKGQDSYVLSLYWCCWDKRIDQIEGGRLSIEFKYEALMGSIDNIFHHARFRAKSASQENSKESNEKISGSLRPTDQGLELDSNTQQTVNELYWEMMSKCACGVDDAHEVTLALLDSLDEYSCVAQVVLIVAAFAISFGEFWQTVEPPLTTEEDHLSRSVCLLKRPQCLIQVTDSVKSGLESVKTLVERIWDLTKWLVEYEEILTGYESHFRQVFLIGYQVVYSVVTCISHNIALVRMNKEYTTLATEFQQMKNSSGRLAYLQSYVNVRKERFTKPGFQTVAHSGGPGTYEDIAKFMSRSISQTGKLVLSHPSRGKVTLKKLKGLCTALFISDFKVEMEEFSSLIKTYKAALNYPGTFTPDVKDPGPCFEVIWVPMMVDPQSTTWTEDDKRMVSSKGASMPWYWVRDPSTIKTSFIQRVKENWHFQRKPILVILDRTGRITHTNALPMMEAWGPSAYPFTIEEDDQLQEGLSDAIGYMFSANNEPKMEKKEGKIICFYGSHNQDWIRKFLQKIEFITVQTNFEMEIIYVGTNKKKEELPSILTFIKSINKTSRVWSEEGILSFWRTLKMSTSPETMDVKFSTRKELFSILSYDEYEDGWALIFIDSKPEVVKSSGTKLIDSLDSFTTRGSRIQEPKDFLKELNEDLRAKHATPEDCKEMKVPTNPLYHKGEMVDGPLQVHCMECGRFMDIN